MTTPVSQILECIDKHQKSDILARGALVLAACKSQPAAAILATAREGIRHFGENRVQEAEEKWLEIKALIPDCCLHLIGPLQTNKVKQAVALFDVIQSVDREKLVDALALEEQRQGRRLAYYLQVNTGEEPQKAGCRPDEVPQLLAHARAAGLSVVGLMCVPPLAQPPAPHFALLRQLADRLGLEGCSMGMSDDFETALRMGSTCVRLGRVLFGERSA